MSVKCQFSVAKCVSAFLLVNVYLSQVFPSMSVEPETEISTLDFSPNPEEVEACERYFSNCENFSTYPRAYIEKLIKDNLIQKESLSGRGVKLMMPEILYDDDPDYKDLCLSTSTLWHPQGRVTKRGEFIYIVQMEVNGEHYYQSLLDHRCSYENQRCFVDKRVFDVTTVNSTFFCVEDNDNVSVIGVTPKGKIVRGVLGVGKCCSCKKLMINETELMN